jgi:hypothetical protein
MEKTAARVKYQLTTGSMTGARKDFGFFCSENKTKNKMK